MKTYEINGEVLVLQHIVNVSKVFEQRGKTTNRFCLGVKVIGRESGFIYDFDSQADAEATRTALIEKVEKA